MMRCWPSGLRGRAPICWRGPENTSIPRFADANPCASRPASKARPPMIPSGYGGRVGRRGGRHESRSARHGIMPPINGARHRPNATRRPSIGTSRKRWHLRTSQVRSKGRRGITASGARSHPYHLSLLRHKADRGQDHPRATGRSDDLGGWETKRPDP
jgi:hypothetical protein